MTFPALIMCGAIAMLLLGMNWNSSTPVMEVSDRDSDISVLLGLGGLLMGSFAGLWFLIREALNAWL